MTVIAAIVKNGQCAIAGDRRISWGGTYAEGDPKVHDKGAALVGRAGSPMFARYVRTYPNLVVPEGGLTREVSEAWVVGLAEGARKWADERGHGASEGRSKKYDLTLVVATPVGLWDCSGDGAVVHIPGGVWAQGSGASEAMGAMHALRDAELTLRELAGKAAMTAIALDVNCGDGIDVLSILNEETS